LHSTVQEGKMSKFKSLELSCTGFFADCFS
jgi:hypothetical protein